MADTLVVYKPDGTLKCENIKPRPLATDAEDLAKIGVTVVGAGKHERLPIFTPQVCGSPTGWANVFSLSTKGLTRTQLLALSTHGFKVWTFEKPPEVSARAGDSDSPFPLDFALASALLPQHAFPVEIKDLPGYALRAYKTGEALTLDYRLDRFNVEISPADHRIVRTWFG